MRARLHRKAREVFRSVAAAELEVALAALLRVLRVPGAALGEVVALRRRGDLCEGATRGNGGLALGLRLGFARLGALRDRKETSDEHPSEGDGPNGEPGHDGFPR